METLNRWQDRVAQAMQDVQGTGTFAVQGDLNLPDPGLAVAFYSDCRHEVRKLRSGYRVCLVYNLSIRRALARKCGVLKQLSAATQTDAVQQLTQVLGQWNCDPIYLPGPTADGS